MFVHLSPVTWQGVEHDNLSTPLDRITQSVAEPVIRSFQVFHVSNFRLAAGQPLQSPWKQCGSWRAKDFKEGNVILNIKLTPAITETGQWKVCFRSASGNNMTLKEPRMIEDGVPATAGMIARTEGLPSALHLTRSASVTRESNNILQVLIDSPDIQVKCTTGPRPASHSAIAGVPSSKLVATASMGPVTTLRTPAAWKGPSFPAPLPASLSARVSVSSMPQLVGMPVRDHEAGFLRLLHAVFYRAAIGICIVPVRASAASASCSSGEPPWVSAAASVRRVGLGIPLSAMVRRPILQPPSLGFPRAKKKGLRIGVQEGLKGLLGLRSKRDLLSVPAPPALVVERFVNRDVARGVDVGRSHDDQFPSPYTTQPLELDHGGDVGAHEGKDDGDVEVPARFHAQELGPTVRPATACNP